MPETKVWMLSNYSMNNREDHTLDDTLRISDRIDSPSHLAPSGQNHMTSLPAWSEQHGVKEKTTVLWMINLTQSWHFNIAGKGEFD